MGIFNVHQKQINQVKKKTELRSTNLLKVNKRKRKQKDIIMKLINNLHNHLKDKKDYLLKLKDSIDIPIAFIKCRKYGHHVMDCGKEENKKKEKDKKEKTKKKQGVNIKPVTLQELKTEAKRVKQESKEVDIENINEQNIAEIINLKELSKLVTEPPSLEKDNLNNDNNKQNFLCLIDKVIFQKQHTEITLVINKAFSLIEIASIDSGADMNSIQE